jgi:hypothetical protein
MIKNQKSEMSISVSREGVTAVYLFAKNDTAENELREILSNITPLLEGINVVQALACENNDKLKLT